MSKLQTLGETALLLTREQVAEMLGCHIETVKRAEQAGKLIAYKFGVRMTRYRLEDVERWVETHRYRPSPSAS